MVFESKRDIYRIILVNINPFDKIDQYLPAQFFDLSVLQKRLKPSLVLVHIYLTRVFLLLQYLFSIFYNFFLGCVFRLKTLKSSIEINSWDRVMTIL